MEYTGMDRVLLTMGDAAVFGTTRLQRYGFLLHKQYWKELSAISNKYGSLKFYDDWKPYWFGPHSESMDRDTKACVDAKLIYKDMVDPVMNLHRYGLTTSGRTRWRRLLGEFGREMEAIRKRVASLQEMRLERLLQGVYDAYPEYTMRGARERGAAVGVANSA